MGAKFSLLCKKEGEWTCFDSAYYLLEERGEVEEQAAVAKEQGFDELRIQEWNEIPLWQKRDMSWEHYCYLATDTEGEETTFDTADTFFQFTNEFGFALGQVAKYLLIKEDVA